jgi:hypothetical protein
LKEKRNTYRHYTLYDIHICFEECKTRKEANHSTVHVKKYDGERMLIIHASRLGLEQWNLIPETSSAAR